MIKKPGWFVRVCQVFGKGLTFHVSGLYFNGAGKSRIYVLEFLSLHFTGGFFTTVAIIHPRLIFIAGGLMQSTDSK
jgi:hypothetical protein